MNKVLVKDDLEPIELPSTSRDNSSVILNGTVNDLRGSIVRQRNAPKDLQMVSWPPNKPMTPFASSNYNYDPMMATGTFVYVLDNGVDTVGPVRLPGSVGRVSSPLTDDIRISC